jgi:hypothetical protein
MRTTLTRRLTALLTVIIFFIFATPRAAAEAPSFPVAVRLDAATIRRGYAVGAVDGGFRLHLPPHSVGPVTVTVTADEAARYPAVTGYAAASNVYTVDLNGASLRSAPLWVEFPYPANGAGQTAIAAFHRERGEWQLLPVRRDLARGLVRAAIPWTFGRFVLLQHRSILELGEASWYRYRSCRCAASPDYPAGTKLKVTAVDSSRTVTVRVNDYGPDRSHHPTRVIDLDREAFTHLAPLQRGLVRVLVEPLPSSP